MIQNIIVDLDGTLVGSEGLIADCVWQAIEKAQAKGIHFHISTGRPGFGAAKKIATRLNENSPHVFQHGAEISYPSGKMLKVFSLPEARALEILEKSRERNIMLEIYSTTNLFIEDKGDIIKTHAKSLGIPAITRDLEEVIKNEPVLRAQYILGKENMDVLEQLTNDDVVQGFGLAGLAKLNKYQFVSFTKSGVDKGLGVKTLAEELRFSLENTMAIGDSTGDVSMLDVVAYPVIMGNAPEELKEKYEQVAGHVDKCGIVEVIEDAISRYPS